MKHLKITLDVPPVAKQRPRTVNKDGKSWTYTPKETKEAEESIRWLMGAAGYRDYFEANVPLSMKATFYVPEPAKAKYDYPVALPVADLDNYCKCLMDALSTPPKGCDKGLVIPNDRQVCEIHVRKVYDSVPRIELEISEI